MCPVCNQLHLARVHEFDDQLHASAWLGYGTQLFNPTLIQTLPLRCFADVIHLCNQLTLSKGDKTQESGWPSSNEIKGLRAQLRLPRGRIPACALQQGLPPEFQPSLPHGLRTSFGCASPASQAWKPIPCDNHHITPVGSISLISLVLFP